MPKFHCIHCGQHIDAAETLAGTTSDCPSCNAQIQVPGSLFPSHTTTNKDNRSPRLEEKRNEPTQRSNANVFLRFTTFRGRINRLQYFYGWLTKIALLLLVGGLIVLMRDDLNDDTSMIIGLIPAFGLIWINLSLHARRLHDMNQSGWWLLLYLVPFVNYVFVFVLDIFCFFQPGTRGKNKYGEFPEPIFR